MQTIEIEHHQEFVDYLDKQLLEKIQICKKTRTEWQQIHIIITDLKNLFLEANDLSQCYSCNRVFKAKKEKFCSTHCKQAENLEVI